jgi:hypothetical protein
LGYTFAILLEVRITAKVQKRRDGNALESGLGEEGGMHERRSIRLGASFAYLICIHSFV